MKRFISIIVAACAFFAASAQNPMVTLSHNGELTFFTNLGAFKAAYEAAENGDILYLSEGNFSLDEGKIDVRKLLSIVGSGYKSHIMGDINIMLSADANANMEAPLFDGVRLDKLHFATNGTSRDNLEESEIIRSWIRAVEYGDYAGTEVLYDKCHIEDLGIHGSGGNVMVKNSKIGKISGNSYNINVVNCNINEASYYPRSMFSSILNDADGCNTNGSCSIMNSLLRKAESSDNVITSNCYIKTDASLLDENLEATVDLNANNYLGEDGKEVGIHGGDSPFSENPSVPTVDTANSSVEYDAAGNKLKVSITVKAD